MIDTQLKDIVVAYFQGGNAAGQAGPSLKFALDAIKEFVEKSQETPQGQVTFPNGNDPRNSSR